jgi:hypothetical protein
VIVEGIEQIDEIARIKKMVIDEFGVAAAKRVRFGAGGLLLTEQTTRKDASTGYKLALFTIEDGTSLPTMKFSDSPGKGSYLGDIRLVRLNGRRVIADKNEVFRGEVEELYVPLLRNGVKLIREGEERIARA